MGWLWGSGGCEFAGVNPANWNWQDLGRYGRGLAKPVTQGVQGGYALATSQKARYNALYQLARVLRDPHKTLPTIIWQGLSDPFKHAYYGLICDDSELLGQGMSELGSMAVGGAETATMWRAAWREWRSIATEGEMLANNQFWQVNTGGKRGELPLTGPQQEEILDYVRKIAPDLPEEHILFVDNLELNTAYGSGWDILNIGSDVMPGTNVGFGTLSANSRISWRGSIAHELIGHREAALSGHKQAIAALEEAQSSIRAARFAPDLSSTERFVLLRDAITRLYKADLKIREVKDLLYIHQR